MPASRISRRRWVGGLGLVGLGVALAASQGGKRKRLDHLVKHPDGILDVLPGFEVIVLQRAGERLSDGYVAPGMPDGMGLFEQDGQWVLMRNHELWPGQRELSPFAGGPVPHEAFDAASHGAVSRLVIDPKSRALVSSNLVLAGTNVNCAGGNSPLGWLSCEENVDRGHGYVFACDPRAERLAPARPIHAFGRFNHEAAVTDAASGITYLTEDRVDGCLYRCVPISRDAPETGKLQALSLEGLTDSGTLTSGASVRIGWVDLEPEAAAGDTLRVQARGRGAAVVRRGEGAFLSLIDGRTRLLVVSTAGGPRQLGQLFAIDDAAEKLEVLYAAEDPQVLQRPDNVTMAPSGHILLAEDGSPPNGLRVMTPQGNLLTLAQNPGPGEIAGVCVAPDGRTVFANLQQRGITLAIVGPLAELS